MLQRPASAKATAQWLTRQGVMEQFRTAAEIEAEVVAGHAPLQGLGGWK